MTKCEAVEYLKNMKWLKGYDNTLIGSKPLGDIIDEIIDVIWKSPDIVYCHNCKYAVPALNGFSEEGFKCANEHSPGYESYWWFEPNWYCAGGERRESDEAD